MKNGAERTYLDDEYVCKGEWSEWSVKPAPTGWVVELSSSIQGNYTGGKYLVRYAKGWPRGASLEAFLVHKGYVMADRIMDYSLDGPDVKVLRRALRVQ